MTTTNAYATAAIEMLKAGTSAADIAAQTGMSTGEIAALAEAEGLTAAHARKTVEELVEALVWGEEHGSKKAQALAARARTALTELVQLRTTEVQVAKAEAEVTALRQKLARAEDKLRAVRTGKSAHGATAMPDGKAEREKIRVWARANGYEVSDFGIISQTIRDAYANRDQVPELRQAG